MSVDTPAADDHDRSPRFACGLCGGPADDDGRFLAGFPTTDAVALSPAERDGVLPLCDRCAAAVAELTVAWDDGDEPPVATAPSIGEAFRDSAAACSFCEGAIGDGPVLGIESWSAENARAAGTGGGASEDDACYALCESCVTVFEEFLAGIEADA